MSIDPGLTTTGSAVFCHSWNKATKKPEIQLVDCSGFASEKKDGNLFRIQMILDQVWSMVVKYDIDNVIIELPGNTIYNQKRATKDMLIARAQAMFQLFGLVYGLQIGLLERMRLTKPNSSNAMHTIFPVQWQPHRKRRDGLATKEWSLQNANAIIQVHGGKQINRFLKTIFDENIADAIGIGFSFLRKLEEKFTV